MARASNRPVTVLVTDPASKADVSGTGPQVRTTGPDPIIRQPAAPAPAPAETRAACSRSVLALASTREAFHPARPSSRPMAHLTGLRVVSVILAGAKTRESGRRVKAGEAQQKARHWAGL